MQGRSSRTALACCAQVSSFADKQHAGATVVQHVAMVSAVSVGKIATVVQPDIQMASRPKKCAQFFKDCDARPGSRLRFFEGGHTARCSIVCRQV